MADRGPCLFMLKTVDGNGMSELWVNSTGKFNREWYLHCVNKERNEYFIKSQDGLQLYVHDWEAPSGAGFSHQTELRFDEEGTRLPGGSMSEHTRSMQRLWIMDLSHDEFTISLKDGRQLHQESCYPGRLNLSNEGVTTELINNQQSTNDDPARRMWRLERPEAVCKAEMDAKSEALQFCRDTLADVKSENDQRSEKWGVDPEVVVSAHTAIRKEHGALPLVWDEGMAQKAQESAIKMSLGIQSKQDGISYNWFESDVPETGVKDAIVSWYGQRPGKGMSFYQMVSKHMGTVGMAKHKHGEKYYWCATYNYGEPPFADCEVSDLIVTFVLTAEATEEGVQVLNSAGDRIAFIGGVQIGGRGTVARICKAVHEQLPGRHFQVLSDGVQIADQTSNCSVSARYDELPLCQLVPAKVQHIAPKTVVGAMQVTVIYTSPEPVQVEYDVQYDAKTTVADFKKQMAEKFGVRPADLLMMSKGGDGKELEDEKTMGDYDFKDPNKPDQHALVAWRICSSPSADEFKLHYKSHGVCFSNVEVKSSEMVGAVKKRVIDHGTDGPQAAKKLKFFFVGKCLEDDKTLADYQIGAESMVYAFHQYSPKELQTVMPKPVLMAAFPNEFKEGEYIQTPATDTTFVVPV